MKRLYLLLPLLTACLGPDPNPPRCYTTKDGNWIECVNAFDQIIYSDENPTEIDKTFPVPDRSPDRISVEGDYVVFYYTLGSHDFPMIPSDIYGNLDLAMWVMGEYPYEYPGWVEPVEGSITLPFEGLVPEPDPFLATSCQSREEFCPLRD